MNNESAAARMSNPGICPDIGLDDAALLDQIRTIRQDGL